VILSSDKSSECNLSSFFDTKKPRRMEHLQSEEPFSSDPYFSIPSSMSQVPNMNFEFVTLKLDSNGHLLIVQSQDD
jgi:hypothetical protein